MSRRTVFNSAGGKAALLKLALDWAIVGDDEPIAMADRPAVKAIQAEPDPRKRLMLWVQTVAEVAARIAPIGEVLAAAADVDPAAAELLAEASRNRLFGATSFITVPRVPGRAGHRNDRATCRRPLLGAHGRSPLPAAGHSARLERRGVHPLAIRQPRGDAAAELTGPQPAAGRCV